MEKRVNIRIENNETREDLRRTIARLEDQLKVVMHDRDELCRMFTGKLWDIQKEHSFDLPNMNEKLIQKGSDQPPTKVGLDDERTKTGVKGETREDKGKFTDKVMEDQSQYHEVQRT